VPSLCSVYVLAILVIGLVVRYDDDRLLNSTDGNEVSSSPFVIAIDRAGIKGLGSVINAVLLVAAWSAGSFASFSSLPVA
jgi:amino acid transporter